MFYVRRTVSDPREARRIPLQVRQVNG